MKKVLFYILFLAITILFLPYVITGMYHNIQKSNNDTIAYDGRLVVLEQDSQVYSMDFNEYLLGMVARNLICFDESVLQNADFIRLNILIANTFLNKQYSNESCISDDFLNKYYIDDEQLKMLWKDNYSLYHDTISRLMNEMSGQILIHDGEPITPYFHQISSGVTRLPQNSTDASYLKSVATNQDLEESGFLSIKSIRYDEFVDTIICAHPDAFGEVRPQNIQEQLQITDRNLEYVENIQVGLLKMNGEAFAELFSLNSSAFTLTFQKDSLKIITKGIGHGYGISLSYAYRMLCNGYSIEDVLNFFYQNVEIKK